MRAQILERLTNDASALVAEAAKWALRETRELAPNAARLGSRNRETEERSRRSWGFSIRLRVLSVLSGLS